MDPRRELAGILFRYDDMGPTYAEMKNLPERAALLALAEEVVAWAQSLISR